MKVLRRPYLSAHAIDRAGLRGSRPYRRRARITRRPADVLGAMGMGGPNTTHQLW